MYSEGRAWWDWGEGDEEDDGGFGAQRGREGARERERERKRAAEEKGRKGGNSKLCFWGKGLSEEEEEGFIRMWHEARRSEKKVHEIMDAARRRAQKRAVFLAKRRIDPHQTLRVMGSRCRVHHDATVYQATEDQQGLIPWNGKDDNLIDRFDGRALLDTIREFRKTQQHVEREKTEEEEELEEMVNFQRYRDLIKHRRRGFNDKQGLEDVDQELESRAMVSSSSSVDQKQKTLAKNNNTYGQVGFAYEGSGVSGGGFQDEIQAAAAAAVVDSDNDETLSEKAEEEGSSSEDSEDELIQAIGREHGVQRFNWMLSLDRKAKEEEWRQKEAVKGDPAMRKLSRKERRKVSQQEREKEKEAARLANNRPVHPDPYRELRKSPTYDSYSYSHLRGRRGRSFSPSPPRSRRYDESDRDYRERKKRGSGGATVPTIEYITEFGDEGVAGPLAGTVPPPASPPASHQVDVSSHQHSTRRILEAIHSDPASMAVSNMVSGPSSTEWERDRDRESSYRERDLKPLSLNPASAMAKLNKLGTPAAGSQKVGQVAEIKTQETPQERLKRIMSKQLNKQIKKDTVTEMGKKREQERERQEKLAETRRIALRRGRGRSRTRSRSRSPIRYRHRSRSRSPSRSYARSRSPRPRSRIRG